MIRLNVGIVSRTFFYVPLWAAMQNGVFANEGLQVETTLMGNASQVPPLLDGSMQVAIGGAEPVLQNVASGGRLRIVAGNTGKLTHSLIAQPRFKRVEDLRGATIGILNMVEGTFFQLKDMMAAHGLNYPGDYSVKETGGVPPRHKALQEGSIDAGLQSIPWNYVAEEEGFTDLGPVSTYVRDWQFVTVNANMDWVGADREPLLRFLRALSRATEWVHSNRDAAAAIAERELPTRRDFALRAWEHYTGTNALTIDLKINTRGLQKVIAVQKAAGLLPQDAPDDVESYTALDVLREARVGLE